MRDSGDSLGYWLCLFRHLPGGNRFPIFFSFFFPVFIDSSYGINISETRADDAGAVGKSTSRR